MGTEIERRFLVSGDGWRGGRPGRRLVQGYLATGPGCTVRVRLAGRQAWLTVKGPTRAGARAEFEYAVPPADARAILERCGVRARVEKVRHRVEHEGRTWEVDEFLGENAPLVMAEVELSRAGERVSLPPWVGREVTEDPRYANAALAQRPFGSWPAGGRRPRGNAGGRP